MYASFNGNEHYLINLQEESSKGLYYTSPEET